MKRILTVALLATSVLAASSPALAAPEDRGGRNVGVQDGSPRGGGGGRQGGWSPGARAPQANPAPAPQPAAPAVRTQQVPASSVSGGGWRGQRDGAVRPATPMPQADGRVTGRSPSDRYGGGTRVFQPAQPGNNGSWQRDAQRNDGDRTRNWRGNDRTPGAPGTPGVGDRNRDGRDWNNGNRNGADRVVSGINNSNRYGTNRDWNNNNNGNRYDRDRNWSNDDRGRYDRDGNWRDRNWNDNDRGRYNGGTSRHLQPRERWAGQRRWDNGWRSDRRYDWQDYRARNRYIYRQPTYYAPYGWNYGYSRFSIGIFLNNLLFAQNYWIDDPYYYRLPPAYGTLRWIRYYDDALLVDIRDGYVVDVIYGFFY